MADYYLSQRQILIRGINVFEPAVKQLHKSYEDDEFIDWPTIVLGTTIQTSAISLFKLLPSDEPTNEPLDKRSIATIIRNIIDTHDVLDMLINATTPEEFDLHRNIMGLYLSARIATVQSKIKPEDDQKFFPCAISRYWNLIKSSSLYEKSMERIRSGETIFYRTRADRIRKACGEHGDFVMGILADLSTYVHSMPPALWMTGIEELYADNSKHRSMVGVWLRVANFYLALSFGVILKMFPQGRSSDLTVFMAQHEKVFND